ncbi:hypothetical protein KW843_07480 [Acidovorax sp. sif1233]|uniref:phage head spike fiber domain-containing protein n=1 Tax=Acidovorax sp. sif1233 TaxID=2854792 RepID=UPI001C453469|nr:hypothetical protein [Acidovorax sp. sif1233]MBV7454307.1 hypothetical protein [Acidovorax sp. sif1233]
MSIGPLPPEPVPIDPLPPAPEASTPVEDFPTVAFNHLAGWNPFRLAQNAQAAAVNALAAHTHAAAIEVDANKLAVDINTALVANYAGAAPWVAGVYAKDVVVSSPVNQRLYRKTTASSATVIDPSADPANWTLVNAMVPFEPVTTATLLAQNGGRYSLQRTAAEGAGTNLLIYSEQFDNAAWTKSNATVAANTAIGPDGDLLADTITATGASAGVYTSIAVAASAVADYYCSVFLKKGTSSKAKIDLYYPGNTQSPLLFDFDTQVISGGAYAGQYIAEYYGAGWWRLGYKVLRDASASKTTMIMLLTPNSGVVGQTILAWGAQIESGAAPTSYIQSLAAPGTRTAGQIPAQRLIFPDTSIENSFVSVHVGNGIDYNVIDPNGRQLEGSTGPTLLDFSTGSMDFQLLNGIWRAVQ